MTTKGTGHESEPHVQKRAKDSDVGYCKPPRQYTWKPGQSGNPKGRRKGSKSEATILEETLSSKVVVRFGGRMKKMTTYQAIILMIAKDALKGSLKNAAFLFNRHAALVSGELQPHDLSDEDRQVLEAFAQRLRAELSSGEAE